MAILAQQGSLVWFFYHSGQEISWYFEGQKQESVGGFDESRLLFVRVARRPDTRGTATCGHDNVMRQIIQLKGIGHSFASEAVRRFQVFWDLDMTKTIRASIDGYSNGEFLGEAEAQPPIAGGVLGATLKPAPGVYVRGIWVRPPDVSGTIMSFFGYTWLRVTGRDRNDVCIHSLSDAVGWVLIHSKQRDLIKSLLEPLKGRVEDCPRVDCDGGGDEEQQGSGNSWLLRSPEFFNRLLDRNACFHGFGKFRDFILHQILDIPSGAVFTSSRTFKSKEPFIKWAIEYLTSVGAPLVPIERDANRILFKEVDEIGLKDLCVRYLSQNKARIGVRTRVVRSCFDKIMAFMNERRVIAQCCKDLNVVYVHDEKMYIPEGALDRELLIKVVATYNANFRKQQGVERFCSILRAIHEYLPPGENRSLSLIDVDNIIKHAERICEDDGISPSIQDEDTSEATTEDEETSPAGMELHSSDDEGKSCSSSSEMPSPRDKANPSSYRMKSRSPRNKLLQKIRKACSELGEESYNDNGFPQGKPGPDIPNPHEPHLHSELIPIAVETNLGGGTIFCDEATVAAIHSKSWDALTCNRISNLRSVLDDAIDRVGECIPSAKPLLGVIKHGYDSANEHLYGFCSHRRGQIVVNLFAYMKKFPGDGDTLIRNRTLFHEIVVTVTHELAHLLEGEGEGHGRDWRQTHASMLVEIMTENESGNSNNVHEFLADGIGRSSSAPPKRKRARKS